MEAAAISILSLAVIYIFYKMWRLKKELEAKTFLFWEQDGEYKVLKNSKGDEITRI